MSDKETVSKKQREIKHLTSENNKKVAKKISETSQMIFERNREAYRVLANK